MKRVSTLSAAISFWKRRRPVRRGKLLNFAEEVVRRDGKLYFVQVRAYLPMADVVRLSTEFEVPPDKLRSTITRLLSGSTEFLGDPARGVSFWMDIWSASKAGPDAKKQRLGPNSIAGNE